MKRWTQAFVLLAAPLLAFQSACDLDCCGDIEIGAEALYWKACTCEWQYGFSGPLQGELQAESVNTAYDWGFRIFGEYSPCEGCSFLALDWTYLHSTDTSSPTAVQVGNANLNNQILAKVRTRYNRVNLRGGYFIHKSCNLSIYSYAGVRWIDLRLKRDVKGNVNTAPEFTEERSRLSGGAIEVGVGGVYRFDCGINFVANFGPLAAIGERKHSFSSSDAIGALSSVYPTRTICFPGLDFRIGLNTTFECRCFTATVEIGYEMDYYFNALTTLTSYGSATLSNGRASACRNIGFSGPYASLGLRF